MESVRCLRINHKFAGFGRCGALCQFSFHLINRVKWDARVGRAIQAHHQSFDGRLRHDGQSRCGIAHTQSGFQSGAASRAALVYPSTQQGLRVFDQLVVQGSTPKSLRPIRKPSCHKSIFTARPGTLKLHHMPDIATPVLYSFRRCPYAMRARLALQASQVAYEHREIVLKNKPEHMLVLSPKGTVPVLWVSEASGHKVLDQSLDIMLWALAQHDPFTWLPASPEDMTSALAWIAWNDGRFKKHLDRYKYPNRFDLDSGIQDRDLGSDFLWQINTNLQKNDFMNGAQWGLTDAALAPFVRQFARVDPSWFSAQEWSALRGWLENFENSPGFLRAMQKVAIWPTDTVHGENSPSGDTLI